MIRDRPKESAVKRPDDTGRAAVTLWQVNGFVSAGQRPAGQRPALPRCPHCKDVIGVYEPVVVEVANGVCETSLAADPWVYGSAHPCFHRSCFEELRAGRS